ncbi:MAG: hypothetical protein AB7U82_08265 [Blastocatellales bacterium]
MINTEPNPQEALAAIVAAGVAHYEARFAPALPAQAVETEAPEPLTALAVDADRQRELCLACPLDDCVGVQSAACPIRIESRRVWRERKVSQ